MRPKLETKTFRSKISKRIFITFLGCALIPIVCLATLAYFQVTKHLQDQSLNSLRHAVKFQAGYLFDQIKELEDDLELLSIVTKKDSQVEFQQLDDRIRARFSKKFNSITLFLNPNQYLPILNKTATKSPQLQPDDIKHMSAGHTLLVEMKHRESKLSILMFRLIDPQKPDIGYLVGDINLNSFFGSNELDNLPIDTQIGFLDSAHNLIFSSQPEFSKSADSLKVNTRGSTSGNFEVAVNKEQYFAFFSYIFLKPNYKLNQWTVILFKAKSDVFAPIVRFKMLFPLFIVLTLMVVLWLSIANIKKSLVPIASLKSGAKRISKSDFSQKVNIQSGDEFEELADSFNQMSNQLKTQFDELNLMAEIGQKITSFLDVEKLSDTILNSINHHLDFDRGAIILVDNKTNLVTSTKSFGLSQDEIDQFQHIFLNSGLLNTKNRTSTAYTSEKPVLINNFSNLGSELPGAAENYFKSLETKSLIWIPVLYESELLGAIALIRTISLRPIQNNDHELLTGIAAQMAVRLKNIYSYQEVLQSEERFRKVFDNSAAGMMLISPDEKILKVNPVFCEILGYSEKEFLSISYRDIICPDNTNEILESLVKMKDGKIDLDSFETKYRHKDGHDVWAFVSTSLQRDSFGEPLHFITHAQDLSAQKKAQKEKTKLEAQLVQAQKMEAIGTLAGGIAHDFNNILMAIIGYTQISMMDAAGDEKLLPSLRHIDKAAFRATNLVKQILTFSRQNKEEMKPIQISPVIKEAVKLLKTTFPKNIEIISNIPDYYEVVLADPTQIHQVVMNLCTNALHAVLDKGSGSLKIDLGSVESLPTKLISADEKNLDRNRSGSYLKLSISDTGCGIKQETLDQIFEPYFTTKDKGKGTGLGLSVVHGIVKKHAGVIDVKSTLGEGATFEIFLPTTELNNAKNVQDSKEMPPGQEKILFVDDEHDITNIGGEILTRLGYKVNCKNDPQTALEEFRQNSDGYDLVITDMSMPEMTGEELSAEMIKIRSDIPIILSTGYDEKFSQKATSKTTIKNYLMKPINLNELANAVRKTIDENQKGCESNKLDFY